MRTTFYVFHLFVTMHNNFIIKVFEEKRYLDAAISCGEVVWKRGLLKKGYGICHGVSGNAYTFLALYKHTENELYLHRALKVSEYN